MVVVLIVPVVKGIPTVVDILLAIVESIVAVFGPIADSVITLVQAVLQMVLPVGNGRAFAEARAFANSGAVSQAGKGGDSRQRRDAGTI